MSKQAYSYVCIEEGVCECVPQSVQSPKVLRTKRGSLVWDWMEADSLFSIQRSTQQPGRERQAVSMTDGFDWRRG